MDPFAVLKLLWGYRFALLPVALVTLALMLYVINFAPRAYESSMSVAIVNPNVPTEIEKRFNRSLADLNSDNPYLRSSDPSLISQVVIARLNATSTARQLAATGLSPEYVVGPGSAGAGFVVNITGIGSTAEESIATTRALGSQLDKELRDVQQVNGAHDRYHFTPIVVTEALEATEQFSGRLRSSIVVFLGGCVLGFAAISAARGVETARQRRQPPVSGVPSVPVGRLSQPEEAGDLDAAGSTRQSRAKQVDHAGLATGDRQKRSPGQRSSYASEIWPDQ